MNRADVDDFVDGLDKIRGEIERGVYKILIENGLEPERFHAHWQINKPSRRINTVHSLNIQMEFCFKDEDATDEELLSRYGLKKGQEFRSDGHTYHIESIRKAYEGSSRFFVRAKCHTNGASRRFMPAIVQDCVRGKSQKT